MKEGPPPIDSTQFHGPGAILALVLAHVRWDYWHAPRSSMAFRTAEMFLDGGTCVHDGEAYDWGEHRDEIVGALGIDVGTFVKAVKMGRRA